MAVDVVLKDEIMRHWHEAQCVMSLKTGWVVRLFKSRERDYPSSFRKSQIRLLPKTLVTNLRDNFKKHSYYGKKYSYYEVGDNIVEFANPIDAIAMCGGSCGLKLSYRMKLRLNKRRPFPLTVSL